MEQDNSRRRPDENIPFHSPQPRGESLGSSEIVQDTALDNYIDGIQKSLDELVALETYAKESGMRMPRRLARELKQISDLEPTLTFARALKDDLTGGAQLEFLTEEERAALREMLLRPASEYPLDDTEDPANSQRAGLFIYIMTLQVRAEMYPTMAREIWQEDIEPGLRRKGISLEEVAQATGTDFETLRGFQLGKIKSIKPDVLGKIKGYLW